MTTAPYVELRVNPTDLRPGDLPKAGEFLGTPADAIEAALAMTRASMVAQMKAEVRGIGEPSHYQLLRIADLAWQAAFWRYRKVSAPVIADAYLHAYQAADAGDVPMSVIYDLADKHAEKVGVYFHETSRQALADGFNSMVNRRIPARVAADRVLDAYGLTPRQMRGYASAKQFGNPVSDVLPRSLKARARTYIQRSFTQRVRKLSEQEEHNIDQQAQQFAWMWLQDKGKLSERAQKMWITAKDEKVCPVCGPLHGQKVGINDQFRTKEGSFWSPGLHPNCRCVVRLLENRFTLAKALGGLDLKEFNEEHPRGYHGRFGTKTRTKLAVLDTDEEFERITQGMTTADPQQDLKFAEIAQYSWLPPARARAASSLPATYAIVEAEAPVETEVWTPVVTPKVESKVETKVETELQTKPKAKAKLKELTETPTKAGTKTDSKRWVAAANQAGDIVLTDRDSYATRSQAVAAARQRTAAEVEQLVGQLIDGGPIIVDSSGNKHTLNEQQTRAVVEYMARQAQAHERSVVSGPETERKVELPLHVKQDGSDRVHIFGVQYLAHQLDVSPEQFTRNEVIAIDASQARKTTAETAGVPLDPTIGQDAAVTGEFKRSYGKEAGRTTGKYGTAVFGAKPKKHD